jgi:hypothetical protein
VVATPPANSVQTDLDAVNVVNNAMRNNVSNGYASNKNDLKQPVSLEKQGDSMRNSYAMRNNVSNVTQGKSADKIGYCAHCGKEFEKRTTWHKYCEELCKIQAYELRTGRKWRGARKPA